MPTHNCYAGEATYTVSGRTCRFKPTGKLKTRHEGATENPVKRIGGGGYSARMFVGLNVGQTQKFDEDDVVEIIFKVRKKQKALADASILSQKGIYEDKAGDVVQEPSVQVIIIDTVGVPKRQFVSEMKDLAETLRKKMKQELVILEIQHRGRVVDVYSVTRK